MTTKPPSRTAEQFVLRMPPGMRDTIAEVAKANGRSMNAEIVARLEGSLRTDMVEKDLKVSPQFLAEFVEHIERVMEKYSIERKPGQDPK